LIKLKLEATASIMQQFNLYLLGQLLDQSKVRSHCLNNAAV